MAQTLLFLIIITFIKIPAAQAQTLLDAMQIFNNPSHSDIPTPGSANSCIIGQESTYYTYSSLTPPPFSHENCREFNINWFCERIAAAAPQRITNSYIQTRRQNNNNLRQRVFSHVGVFFNNLLRNNEIIQGCCGPTEPASICRQNLSQTKLKIIPATSPGDSTAFYDSSSNQIRLSESMLLNSLTPEANERVILHELGHACQFSRHLTPGPNHWSVALNTTTAESCDNDSGGFSDFLEILPGAANCLRQSLHNAADHWHSIQSEKPCRNSWAMEAFADTIFAFYRRSPMLWDWNCQAVTDVLHGPSRLAMECLLSQAATSQISPRPTLLDSICSQPGP